MDPSASCVNCQPQSQFCPEHGGVEQTNHDFEAKLHAKNQKGLRQVIVNFTPSFVQSYSTFVYSILTMLKQMGKKQLCRYFQPII